MRLEVGKKKKPTVGLLYIKACMGRAGLGWWPAVGHGDMAMLCRRVESTGGVDDLELEKQSILSPLFSS